MSQSRTRARIAGLVYLAVAMVAPVRLMIIPSRLFAGTDPATAARNIVAHETLFRIGIACDLVNGVLVLGLTWALYRLFADVDRNAAIAMVMGAGPKLIA
jgi:hypothetical protein